MSVLCHRKSTLLLSFVELVLLLQWLLPHSTAFVPLASRAISRRYNQYPNSFGAAGACIDSWRENVIRPSSSRVGVAGEAGSTMGALKAALEVFPAERVEPGCVLWASAENYGHSTFKVRPI